MSSRLYNPPSGSAKYWTGMDQAIKNKDEGTQVILDFYVLHFSLVTIVRGHREALIHRQTLTHDLPPPSICLRSILHSLSNAASINTMIDVQGYEVEVVYQLLSCGGAPHPSPLLQQCVLVLSLQ